MIENLIKENPNMYIKKGHLAVKLKCLSCGKSGETTYGSEEFKSLGKDRLGHLYFECPQCKKHLQFHPITGEIKQV
jgi:hypothetical protein